MSVASKVGGGEHRQVSSYPMPVQTTHYELNRRCEDHMQVTVLCYQAKNVEKVLIKQIFQDVGKDQSYPLKIVNFKPSANNFPILFNRYGCVQPKEILDKEVKVCEMQYYVIDPSVAVFNAIKTL